jgi:hypothetical protein
LGFISHQVFDTLSSTILHRILHPLDVVASFGCPGRLLWPLNFFAPFLTLSKAPAVSSDIEDASSTSEFDDDSLDKKLSIDKILDSCDSKVNLRFVVS